MSSMAVSLLALQSLFISELLASLCRGEKSLLFQLDSVSGHCVVFCFHLKSGNLFFSALEKKVVVVWLSSPCGSLCDVWVLV